MILLIDAGNTRIKWRALDAAGETAVAEGAFGHDRLHEFGALLRQLPGLERVLGANVAGDAVAATVTAALAERAGGHGLRPQWLLPTEHCCGVRNLYAQPAQLGADRWAALIGARAQHRHAALVVTAGTATTIDVLDGAGNFQGGLILPGVDLMRRALALNTARLPFADGHYADTPRTTADAIHSGSLQAQAGAVERMFRQLAGDAHALCLLGGGAADGFAPLLELPLRRVDNLVLDGLARIAAEDPGLPR